MHQYAVFNVPIRPTVHQTRASRSDGHIERMGVVHKTSRSKNTIYNLKLQFINVVFTKINSRMRERKFQNLLRSTQIKSEYYYLNVIIKVRKKRLHCFISQNQNKWLKYK